LHFTESNPAALVVTTDERKRNDSLFEWDSQDSPTSNDIKIHQEKDATIQQLATKPHFVENDGILYLQTYSAEEDVYWKRS